MHKKTLICLLCLLALLLGCVGCGEGKTEETAAAESAQAGDTLRVPPESFGGEKTPKKADGEQSEKPAGGEKAEKPAADGKSEKPSEGEKQKDAEGAKPTVQSEGEKGEKPAGNEKSEKSAEGEKKADGTDKAASGEKSDASGEKPKSGKKGKWGGKKGKWGGKKGGRKGGKKTGDETAAETPAPGAEAAAEAPAGEPAAPAGEDRRGPEPEAELTAEAPPEKRDTNSFAEGEAALPNLEGAWEPRGYVGPRVEISGSRLIRLWRGAPVLVTEFKLKQDGESFVLELKDNEMKYTGEQTPYATIKSCVYEDGELTLTDDFPITGESVETLRRTKNSRYGAGKIVSETVLPGLAGRWEQDGGDLVLEFSGNHLDFGYGNHVEGGVNIIAIQNRRDKSIAIRDIDPAVENVGLFGGMTLEGDTISAFVPVADAPAVNYTFHRAPTPTGGSTDYSNYNAVKAIKDTKIAEFDCTISLMSFYLPDEKELTSPRYELSAKRDGESVTCVRRSVDGEETFTKDAAFMEKLQAIVAKYDLAQFNGHDVVAHGLPDDFGATLHAVYSSGEKIAAADNQNMFLPEEAVRELVRLFYAP